MGNEKILLLFAGFGIQYSGRKGQRLWTNGNLREEHFPRRGSSCRWTAAGG